MWSRTCWGLRTTFFHSVDYIWLCCFLLTKAAPNALRQVLLCLWSTCTSPSFQNSSGIAEVLRELSLRILGMLMLQDFLLDFDTWPIALYTYIYIYWYVYIIYIYIFVCVNNIYIYILVQYWCSYPVWCIYACALFAPLYVTGFARHLASCHGRNCVGSWRPTGGLLFVHVRLSVYQML